jgi:hypothetical protein
MFLSRFFGHSPSDAQDTSPSYSLDWVRNILKQHGQSGEGTEMQGRSATAVEVPYAKGKRVCSLSPSDIQLFQLHLEKRLCEGEPETAIAFEEPYCRQLTSSQAQCRQPIFATTGS